MRVLVSCSESQYETIGEQVSFDGYPDEFVVHANLSGIFSYAPFCVTHSATGFRVDFGDSIDEAISNAAKKLAGLTEEKFKAAVERANAMKESIPN
jgi:hypothetical protein